MEFIKNSITHEGIELFPMPMSVVKKYTQFLNFSFYLKSGEKIFKIRHDVDAAEEILARYEKKGVREIFFEQAGYLEFLDQIKTNIKNKIFNPETITEENHNMLSLNDAYILLRSSLMNFGMTESSIGLAEEINKSALKIMKEAPNLFILYKKFSKSCQKGFISSMFTSYFTSNILDECSWSNKKVKHKLNLAAMLSYILLTDEQYDSILNETESLKKLPVELKDYPLKTAQLAERFSHTIGKEVIQAIELHREKPDGSGWPKGFEHNRIGRLPSILILAQFLTSELVLCEFDYGQRNEIYQKLKENFNYPHFREGMKFMQDLLL